VHERERESARGTEAYDALEAIVSLRDRGAAEGVGLDDLSAGVEVTLVHVVDDLRPRQGQEVVVALERLGMIDEPSACAIATATAIAIVAEREVAGVSTCAEAEHRASRTSIVLLGEFVGLQGRASGTIHDHDALAERGAQLRKAVVCWHPRPSAVRVSHNRSNRSVDRNSAPRMVVMSLM